VTEHGVATFDDVINDWSETSLVYNVDITDVMLSFDVEYLTLKFHVKALKDAGICSTCGPRLCVQNDGENKRLDVPLDTL